MGATVPDYGDRRRCGGHPKIGVMRRSATSPAVTFRSSAGRQKINTPRADSAVDFRSGQGIFLRLLCSYFRRLSQPRTGFVYERFAKRSLLRRVVALTAAYAIALSSLIASFSAVRAAVADATSFGTVICQPTLLGHTAPTGVPIDCDSCLGCLVLLAAVPPPPTMAVTIEQAPGCLLPLPVKAELPFDPQTRSHQSRAPPRQV